MDNQVIITINEFIQKALITWLQDNSDKEFVISYKGFPKIIFRKDELMEYLND